jgi:hypothetical protein
MEKYTISFELFKTGKYKREDLYKKIRNIESDQSVEDQLEK